MDDFNACKKLFVCDVPSVNGDGTYSTRHGPKLGPYWYQLRSNQFWDYGLRRVDIAGFGDKKQITLVI